MNNKPIPSSELIINDDGSVFHLHILPEDLADIIIMMGDPGRVSTIAEHFDTIELDKQSREFHTITGTYRGKRVTALSHGIGTDNIDIVMTELDALANIDFKTRLPKAEHRRLTLLRIGTCGAAQPDIPLGSYILSHISIGFDGVLNWYKDGEKIFLMDFENAFVKHMDWPARLLMYEKFHSKLASEKMNRPTMTNMVLMLEALSAAICWVMNESSATPDAEAPAAR